MNGYIIFYRSLMLIVALLLFVIGWLVWAAFDTYDQGTARNIISEILVEPFSGGSELVYVWSGDVWRSCDVTIRREIVTSGGVVVQLLPSTFTAPPPSDLGPVSYPVRVDIPQILPEGPAVYQVTEVPRCTWLQRLFPVAVRWPPVAFNVTPPPE